MPRGGRRNGRPGAAYPNRTDLAQPVRTAPGQTYGQAGQQAAAQKMIPLPATPSAASPAAPPLSPPEPGMLAAPTARPSEPVTAGLPIGAGPGPEALATPSQSDQTLANLRAAFDKQPTEGLRALIDRLEQASGY